MRSDNRLKRVWVELVGESAEFRNVNIAVNSICVITCGLLFIMMVSDLMLGLYEVSAIVGGLILINAILFYFSRYKKKYNPVILIYTIVSYIALGLSFVFNFGINGPTVLGFFLTFLLLVAIVKRKYHLSIAIVHTAFLVALYFAEYVLPHWFIGGYSSDLIRIADWSIAYMICLAFTYFIVMFLRDSYKRERILAQQQAMDITEQNERLKNLIAEKDKLFSLISHDIASPLTLIQGYLEMLGDDIPADQQREVREGLLSLTRRTSDMLVNMLTWSKSQMKGVKINTQSFNVNELLQKNLPLYHSIAEAKDIRIDTSACNDVIIHADEEMTKAIFRNLLSNAIKFTPSDGEIRLAIERNGSLCYIHVSDNGIGMSPEKQKELFTLNSKATYGTHNETGVGLGLVLCKEFAELQKGIIRVESAENEGSRFTVGLPLG
ncbi:sensor histidine kinase [Daejeonella lutea]|uniref:histidine kinase n=1 Tax=Daejeonella lutea TaxID=572036 RepID=A0A1T5EC10_9SPHI|nr:HAMP domain-containing sensor histidine kinase [Daejeonella lutea]SKB81225.1 Signal transduction histidine kinase [Daejeonella lutea]